MNRPAALISHRVSTRSRALLAMFSLALFAMLWVASPANAQSAFFSGEPLAHPFIEANGHIFVALDDIAVPLGLSVVYDGERLLIGGTVRGTLTVDPNSHLLRVRGEEIDYEEPPFEKDGLWYLPECFLERALGLRARLDPETQELGLFPLVVAITPAGGVVRITSSLPPIYRTFELQSPPRRVIDINGAFLGGQCPNVPGSVLGIPGVTELRASQFCEEPPTVRVVLEWEGDNPPNHTLLPEQRTLAVMIGSTTADSSPAEGHNLLAGPAPSADLPEPQIPEEGEDGSIPADEGQGAEGGEENPAEDPVEIPGDRAAPTSRSSPSPRLITPPDLSTPGPDLPVPPGNFPEGAESLPLDQLGWRTSLVLDGEGELVATIDAPPFEELEHFTLSDDEGMRLVLDIRGAYVPGDERRIEGLGDVARIRLAQFEPDVTRIVFDLGRHAGYQIEQDAKTGHIVVRLFAGSLSGKTIVIDPGHGGEDPGAVVDGVMEKDLNLSMAFRLRDLLVEQGARVVLTRTGDYYVKLADRLAIAERERADLFICVHNNATEEPTNLQGALILCADKDPENRERMRLYGLVHAAIVEHTKVIGLGPVPDKRGLYILRHAGDVPVLFVEAAFMTNRIDLARLTDASGAYSENIMLGVAQGVSDFYLGRIPTPVKVPDYALASDGRIFDLAGQPLLDDSGEGHVADAVASWENPPEVSSDDEETEVGTDDEEEQAGNGDEDGDDKDDPERRRGRGAYRYR